MSEKKYRFKSLEVIEYINDFPTTADMPDSTGDKLIYFKDDNFFIRCKIQEYFLEEIKTEEPCKLCNGNEFIETIPGGISIPCKACTDDREIIQLKPKQRKFFDGCFCVDEHQPTCRVLRIEKLEEKVEKLLAYQLPESLAIELKSLHEKIDQQEQQLNQYKKESNEKIILFVSDVKMDLIEVKVSPGDTRWFHYTQCELATDQV